MGPRNRNSASLMVRPHSSMVRRSMPRPKPPCGRAAVLEELQIELDILGQTLFLGLLLQHLVAVLTLGTGGDLHAAPDQVVALGHAVLVAHVVERALLGGIIGDEEELVAVVLLHPLVAQALGLGGQIALFGLIDGVAELFFQTLVQVGQLDHGERSGRAR